jgi:hypothetical protein
MKLDEYLGLKPRRGPPVSPYETMLWVIAITLSLALALALALTTLGRF